MTFRTHLKFYFCFGKLNTDFVGSTVEPISCYNFSNMKIHTKIWIFACFLLDFLSFRSGRPFRILNWDFSSKLKSYFISMNNILTFGVRLWNHFEATTPQKWRSLKKIWIFLVFCLIFSVFVLGDTLEF